MAQKIKLHGFNNLTKSLSFNIYELCYAGTEKNKQDYIRHTSEQYNSKYLTKILTDVAHSIEATVLNISGYDYDPHGASAVLLIAEEPETLVAHLDKSHITVHTYPEYHPNSSIATFRVDIDVATCGEISPLSTLDYLIGSFKSHIITLDYKVRGFTRTITGEKLYIDHRINSIQDYIHSHTLQQYHTLDINAYQSNIFHTKMIKKDIASHISDREIPGLQKTEVIKEIYEIYNGANITEV